MTNEDGKAEEWYLTLSAARAEELGLPRSPSRQIVGAMEYRIRKAER